MTDGVDDVILVKDLEGRYLTINPGGARLMQASIEAIIGCDDRQFLDADTAERIRAHDLRVIAEGVAHTYEEEIVSAGTARTFLTVKAPHRDGSGKIIGLIGISRDITERKRAEEEIRVLNTELEQRVADRTAELESVDHALEAFSYSVSHDLRTPRRDIDGFAQALAEDYGDRPADHRAARSEIAETRRTGSAEEDAGE